MALIGTLSAPNVANPTITGTVSVPGSLSGTLTSDNTTIRKRLMYDSTVYYNDARYIEELHTFRNTGSLWYKINVGAYYAIAAQGCNLTIQACRMSEHATTNKYYEYRLQTGTGQGSDPAAYNIYWWTVRETTVGWGYYTHSFTVRLYYPNGGTNRDFMYLKLETSSSGGYNGPGYVMVTGVAVPSSSSVLEYLGTSAPTLTNYAEKTSDGTW